jgi:hypothetical protein
MTDSVRSQTLPVTVGPAVSVKSDPGLIGHNARIRSAPTPLEQSPGAVKALPAGLCRRRHYRDDRAGVADLLNARGQSTLKLTVELAPHFSGRARRWYACGKAPTNNAASSSP